MSFYWIFRTPRECRPPATRRRSTAGSATTTSAGCRSLPASGRSSWRDTARRAWPRKSSGRRPPRRFLRCVKEVLNTTRQFGAICIDFVTHDRFDLFLAVFGAAHRGSHYLWDLLKSTFRQTTTDRRSCAEPATSAMKLSTASSDGSSTLRHPRREFSPSRSTAWDPMRGGTSDCHSSSRA